MPRQRRAKRGEINGDLVDRFTLLHFGTGVALGGLTGMPLWGVAIVAVGWELIENPLKDAAPEAFPNPTHDSIGNAVLDATAMLAGAALARLARVGVKGAGSVFGALRGGRGSPSSPPSSTPRPPEIPAVPPRDGPPPAIDEFPKPGRRAVLVMGSLVWPVDRAVLPRAFTVPEVFTWLESHDPELPIDVIDIGGAEYALAAVEQWAKAHEIEYRTAADWADMLTPLRAGDLEVLQRSFDERFGQLDAHARIDALMGGVKP